MKIGSFIKNKKISFISTIALIFIMVITVSLVKINNNQVYSLEDGEKECVTGSGENSTVCYAVESFSFPINPDFTTGTVSGLTEISTNGKTCLAGTDTMNMADIVGTNIVRINNYSAYLTNISDRQIILGYDRNQWASGTKTGASIISNASKVLYLNSTDSEGKTYCLPNGDGSNNNIAYLFEPDVGWNLPHKFYARTTNSNGEDEIYISYCLQESFASPAHYESGNTPHNKTIPSLTKLSESEYKAINTKYPTRNYNGLSTKTISSTSIDKVINIITNGYPGSTNYWYKQGFCGTSTSNGGPSSECEDAMFAATQTAIWYVLQGEPGNEDEDTTLKNLKNTNYLTLNATAFDIVGMARKLINKANGDANTGELALGKLSEPSVSVSDISITKSGDSKFVATFTVTAKDLDPGYNLTFSGITGDITVRRGTGSNQTTITAKNGVYSVKNTTDSTDTITVEFSKCGNYNKTLSVSVEALGTNSEGLVYFTDNYDSNGNVILGTHNDETRPIQQTIGMQVISVATGDTKTKTATTPDEPISVTFTKTGSVTGTTYEKTSWAIYTDKTVAQKVANNNGSTAGTKTYETFTTDQDGRATVSNLYRNTSYYIVETSAPAGVSLTNKVYEFKADDTCSTSSSQTFSLEDPEWTLGLTVVKQEKGVKYSNDNTNLSGAVFALQEWSEKEGNYKQVGTLKDNGNGTYSVYEYTIRSTGKKISNSKLYYTEDNLGKFKVVETKAPFGLIPSYSEEITITSDNTGKTVKKTAYDNPILINLTINKVDAETETAQGDAKLSGAIYAIYADEDIYHPDKLNLAYSKGTKVDEIILTADGQNVASGTFKNLYPGKYYIKEVKAPEGYKADKSNHYVTLEIPKDYYPTSSQTVNLTATPQKFSDTVMKQKIEIDKMTPEVTPAKPLEGVGFTFYSVTKILEKNKIKELPYNAKGYVDTDVLDLTGCEVVIGSNGEKELFTNADGKFVTIDLPYATYLVVETTSNPYYGVQGAFTFSIPVYDSGESGENYKDMHQFNIINFPYKAYVKIVKVDSETGKAIPQSGITFKIKDSEGNYVSETYSNGSELVNIDEWTTNEGGYLMTHTELNAGVYYLEEVVGPEGYVKADDLLEFTVTSTDGDSQGIVTIEMKNEPTTVEFYKLELVTDTDDEITDDIESDENVDGSEDTDKVVEENKDTIKDATVDESADEDDSDEEETASRYEFVSGATLTIYYADEDGNILTDSDGNEIVYKHTDEYGKLITATWVTGQEKHVIKHMPVGNYVLVETSTPENSAYITSTNIPFTVEETSEAQTVIMEDGHTNVSFKKIDSATGEVVEGAVLQLEDENGVIIDTWTTTSDPYVIENILVPGKTYTLVELSAPEGYLLNASGMTFTVNDEAEQTIEFLNSPIPDVPDTSKTVSILIIIGALVVAIGTVLVALSRKLKLQA